MLKGTCSDHLLKKLYVNLFLAHKSNTEDFVVMAPRGYLNDVSQLKFTSPQKNRIMTYMNLQNYQIHGAIW
jgi:hypothetical protein